MIVGSHRANFNSGCHRNILRSVDGYVATTRSASRWCTRRKDQAGKASPLGKQARNVLPPCGEFEKMHMNVEGSFVPIPNWLQQESKG